MNLKPASTSHAMKSTSTFTLLSVAFAMFAAGCAAPVGADRVTTRQAYAQLEGNALRTGQPSAETDSILHRYGLDRLAARPPSTSPRPRPPSR